MTTRARKSREQGDKTGAQSFSAKTADQAKAGAKKVCKKGNQALLTAVTADQGAKASCPHSAGDKKGKFPWGNVLFLRAARHRFFLDKQKEAGVETVPPSPHPRPYEK